MAKACMDVLTYDYDKSNIASLNVLKQAKFLPEIIKKLEQDPKSVIDDLNELREICMSTLSIRALAWGTTWSCPFKANG